MIHEPSGNPPAWKIVAGEGPLVAAAIHHGHAVRAEVAELLALDASQRLREEDPYTGLWTSIAGTRIIGLRSRFEVDLNRPRDKAVYLDPADAWGLTCWKDRPPQEIIARSLTLFDEFYAALYDLLNNLASRHGRVLVLDLHSYNHRRAGSSGAPADPEQNPAFNIGTGSIERNYWGPVLDALIGSLRGSTLLGVPLDVRENVKFQGGGFPRWVHQSFPRGVCAIAIEVKKFFMDEWTGQADMLQVGLIHRALSEAARAAEAALKTLPQP